MRQYPQVYSQRDPQWANQTLGTSGTIGQYGCIMTCHAMKAGYYGHQINPSALNDAYKNHQPTTLYVSGNLLSDDAVTKVFSDIKLIDVKDWTSIPADLGYLKTLAQDPTKTVTIEVDFDHIPNDGIQTHFVELHEFDGTTLTIYDPWYGQEANFTVHYGTNIAQTIQKIAVYQGNVGKPKIAVDQDTFTQLVTNSTANDAVCDDLGLAHNAGKDAEIAAINQLKADKATAEQSVANLNKQIPDLEGQLQTAQNNVTSLEQQLRTAQDALQHPSGNSYQDLYNQAELDLTAAKQALADSEAKYLRSVAQFQNTSALLIPVSKLFQIFLSRALHLS